MNSNRREFIRRSSIAGISAVGLSLSGNIFAGQEEKGKNKNPERNGKLRAGFIGVGSRCRSHLHDTLSIPDVEVVAICDIQQNALTEAKKIIQ